MRRIPRHPLIGAHMVALHGRKMGRKQPRVSKDADILVNARVISNGTERVSEKLLSRGFSLDGGGARVNASGPLIRPVALKHEEAGLKTTQLPSSIEHMRGGVSELVFDVTQDQDGGYVAECLGEDIVTQADNWQELRANVREAVTAFYFDRSPPGTIRLHLVRDEIITVT